MAKFKCINKDNYSGNVIEGDFPDKIMVCFPLVNLLNFNDEEFWLLIPEKQIKNEKRKRKNK